MGGGSSSNGDCGQPPNCAPGCIPGTNSFDGQPDCWGKPKTESFGGYSGGSGHGGHEGRRGFGIGWLILLAIFIGLVMLTMKS